MKRESKYAFKNLKYASKHSQKIMKCAFIYTQTIKRKTKNE